LKIWRKRAVGIKMNLFSFGAKVPALEIFLAQTGNSLATGHKYGQV